MQSAFSLHAIVNTPTTDPAPPSPGVPEAFEAVYNEHAKAVFYFVLRLVGDAAQAEDATHDVFVKAFKNMPEFRGEAKVRTWLYRIAINHCHNLAQTWYKRHIFSNANEALWDASCSSQFDPLRKLETKELGERIQKALGALPEEYRVILLLAADERLSYEEIAALTDQTSDAVRGKLYRARKAFTDRFRETA